VNVDSRSLKSAQRVFRSRLVKWWQANNRSFSWRQTDDLYEILIAEILLRRTNAVAAQQVYMEFLKKFPTKESLAAARHASIEKIASKLDCTGEQEI